MTTETEKCPVCHSDNTSVQRVIGRNAVFCICPACGCFELDQDITESRNMNHLASYLFYNAFHDWEDSPSRYYTELSEEYCAEIREKHRTNKALRLPYHMDAQIIENWYPKSFAERINRVLVYLAEETKHLGEPIDFSVCQLQSLLFIDRREPSGDERVFRDSNKRVDECYFMLDYLKKEDYIDYSFGKNIVRIRLNPKGYDRVDYLQTKFPDSKDALIAMEFGDNTRLVREAIRKGVKDAGYNPIIYDEVENNEYIMPELLKSIRDSRFVVVDLSDNNNGAYFEEGYAMGIGKPVIQLCRKGVELHFDTAQKNTIVWETEGELSERLKKRIKATIE